MSLSSARVPKCVTRCHLDSLNVSKLLTHPYVSLLLIILWVMLPFVKQPKKSNFALENIIKKLNARLLIYVFL